MIPLDIPASSRLFEGHFPGRPILPGVGLLDLALRALPPRPHGQGLRSVDHWKLRHVVLPGERLALDASAAGPDGTMRLEVVRGHDLVARGAVTFGEPAGSAPAVAVAAGGAPARLAIPDLDRLLPHRSPMRFVVGVEAEAENGIVCTAGVPAGGPLAAGGTAPALVAIEMAAQSAAVFEALRRRRAAVDPITRATDAPGARATDRDLGIGPRIGYLVGARGVRFLSARIPADTPCRVAIRLAGVVGPLSTYEFGIDRDGRRVAEGSVSTWITATGA